MPRYPTNIIQEDLPVVTDMRYSAMRSSDYGEYLQKKKGLSTYRHARSLNAANGARCKADPNFKLSFSNIPGRQPPPNEQTRFYNYTSYETRTNVAKIYNTVHPYCELDTDGGTTNTGGEIVTTTLDQLGVEGNVTHNVYVDDGGNPEVITPTVLNEIKGALPIRRQCVNFLNGFGGRTSATEYRFRLN
jgi:hypothetical protein